ncbi:hypothetical protein ACH5RR_040458 [Cinchona calisaya]|uniref:Uncharacterized protein n=1 Tax=Cinchona calisaya TaxID=153742 RepID=A0ABD2XTL4_9GENT
MANEKPQIISKHLIKPSSPTPKRLKTYNLSVLDQLSPRIYFPIVLFYPALDSKISCNIKDISSRLKKSLSETLTHYYPFAGQISSKDFIDCNDEGVDFYEALINCELIDILKKPDSETMDLFSPPGILFNESFTGSPVIIQVTYFKCGGIALSVCMSHKVNDAGALYGFINDWTAVTRGEKVSPIFLTQKIISSLNNGQKTIPEIKHEKDNVVTRRFSFDPSKLADLKAIIARDDSGTLEINPSRVEVVTTLLYMCAMAASKAKTGMSRPSMLIQVVNLRPRVVPPLPENSVGNFCWSFSIITNDENDNTMKSIVASLKKAATGFYEKIGNGMTAEKYYSLIGENLEEVRKVTRENKTSEIESYRCSSWCRYPFSEMNFGWGQPIWVGTFNGKKKNTFTLMDSVKQGGINALVTLEFDKMAIFEKDEELLRFAIMSPNAIGD